MLDNSKSCAVCTLEIWCVKIRKLNGRCIEGKAESFCLLDNRWGSPGDFHVILDLRVHQAQRVVHLSIRPRCLSGRNSATTMIQTTKYSLCYQDFLRDESGSEKMSGALGLLGCMTYQGDSYHVVGSKLLEDGDPTSRNRVARVCKIRLQVGLCEWYFCLLKWSSNPLALCQGSTPSPPVWGGTRIPIIDVVSTHWYGTWPTSFGLPT